MRTDASSGARPPIGTAHVVACAVRARDQLVTAAIDRSPRAASATPPSWVARALRQSGARTQARLDDATGAGAGAPQHDHVADRVPNPTTGMRGPELNDRDETLLSTLSTATFRIVGL